MYRNENLPTRRTGLSPFDSFSDIFDRYARDFFSPTLNEGLREFMPKLEVKETDTSYLVSAELPGLKADDIHLSLNQNNLIIEGERKKGWKKEENSRTQSEFHYGTFYRSIPLEADVADEGIEASFQDGILTVTLTKKADGTEKNKRIKIRSGSSTKH